MRYFVGVLVVASFLSAVAADWWISGLELENQSLRNRVSLLEKDERQMYAGTTDDPNVPCAIYHYWQGSNWIEGQYFYSKEKP